MSSYLIAPNFENMSKLNAALVITIYKKNLFDLFSDNYNHFSIF